MSWRSRTRAVLPRSVVLGLDACRRELPIRLRDAIADLFDRCGWAPRPLPIPPPALRASVGRSSSREEFLEAGAVAALEIVAAFLKNRDASRAYPVWLDFGCGPGRIARCIRDAGVGDEIVGVDPNSSAIAWCTTHLPFGRFVTIETSPPLPLAESSVDVVFAASVFTHFSEDEARGWLAEMRRILRPGGLLIASTHSASVAALRPELDGPARDALGARGFTFLAGSGPFNDRAAFHTRDYLAGEWGRSFEMCSYEPAALFRFQDLSVWRKPSPPRS
jgi:SAM-dependent methyltransferase